MKRICKICNEEFYLKLSAVKKGKGKFCSKKCSVIGQVKKRERNCLYCNNSFFVIPHKIKLGLGKFCSRKCYEIDRNNKKLYSNCLQCNKRFKVWSVILKRGGGKYCSRECQYISSKWRKIVGENAKGEKSSFWRGGLTALHSDLRKTSEYLWWRREVFQRDNYSCQLCGSKNNLEADHIKPFALFPELRLELSNGRTLCKTCHLLTPTYGRGTLSLKEDYGKYT